MKLRALNIEILFGVNKETIRRKKIHTYEKSATEALIGAEMTLELQRYLLTLKDAHNRTEDEIKGIETAIENEEKSVNNWTAQLEVIKSWK